MWAYCIYPLMVLLFLPSDLPQMYETVTSFISKDLIFTHPSRHPGRSSKYKYSQTMHLQNRFSFYVQQTCEVAPWRLAEETSPSAESHFAQTPLNSQPTPVPLLV